MTNWDDRMQDIWGGLEGGSSICSSAQQFQKFTDALCKAVEQNPSLDAVYKAKLIVTDRYFDYRSYVPKAHRYRVTEGGHYCIWHCFEAAYHRLRVVELSLAPPLFPVVQPLSQPRPGIFGLEEE